MAKSDAYPVRDSYAVKFDPENDKIKIDTTTFEIRGTEHLSEKAFLALDNRQPTDVDGDIRALRDVGFRVIRPLRPESVIAHELRAMHQELRSRAMANKGLRCYQRDYACAKLCGEIIAAIVEPR